MDQRLEYSLKLRFDRRQAFDDGRFSFRGVRDRRVRRHFVAPGSSEGPQHAPKTEFERKAVR
jgi:hypothetical protein